MSRRDEQRRAQADHIARLRARIAREGTDAMGTPDPPRRGSSLRTLFEIRGVTWAVLLAGCVLLGSLAYCGARLVAQ